MSPITFTSEATAKLQEIVRQSCEDREHGLPCAQVSIVGDGSRYASDLFECGIGPNSDGNANVDSDHDIYWLASCTKLVTAISCMQLVEQGRLALDDADQLAGLCPELAKLKVIGEDGQLESQKKPITLRMLLTHTAGFGYSFMNPKLKGAFNELSGQKEDFNQPLVNQPGQQWEYGINMDWAGIAIERVTGQRLNDYMQQSIFKPLGITDLTLLPSPKLIERLAGMWRRDADGTLKPREHLYSKALDTATAAESLFHSGGGGLFGSLKEFSKILATLLHDGKSPTTGSQILQASTVQEMFTNQIPDRPDFGRKPVQAMDSEIVYPAPGLYPLCESLPQGWGLSFMISPSITGRSDTTVHWSGVSNIFWWCDRERGIAGIVGSQILPFADPKLSELWVKVEIGAYEALSSARA